MHFCCNSAQFVHCYNRDRQIQQVLLFGNSTPLMHRQNKHTRVTWTIIDVTVGVYKYHSEASSNTAFVWVYFLLFSQQKNLNKINLQSNVSSIVSCLSVKPILHYYVPNLFLFFFLSSLSVCSAGTSPASNLRLGDSAVVSRVERMWSRCQLDCDWAERWRQTNRQMDRNNTTTNRWMDGRVSSSASCHMLHRPGALWETGLWLISVYKSIF